MSGAMNEKEIEELGEATQVLYIHFFTYLCSVVKLVFYTV